MSTGPGPALEASRRREYLASVSVRLLLSVAFLSSWASLAEAQGHTHGHTYRGPHPIDLEGHWHLEEVDHVHGELTSVAAAFGEVGGVHVFLGDPTAFGWAGDVWVYGGVHPLPGALPGYCGITREHRHPFAPEGAFRVDDGVHVYQGGLRGGLPMVRPRRIAPRRPVAAVERPPAGVPTTPGIAPYWFAGCLHRLVMGPDGLVPVPLAGCVPRAGRRAAPAQPAPPAAVPRLEDRYTRVQSRPQRAPARTRATPRQR